VQHGNFTALYINEGSMLYEICTSLCIVACPVQYENCTAEYILLGPVLYEYFTTVCIEEGAVKYEYCTVICNVGFRFNMNILEWHV